MSRRPNENRAPRPEWAAVSVDYFDDPDIARLPAAIQLAHLRLVLFTVKAQTDGAVDSMIAQLAHVTRKQLRELETAELIIDGRLKGWLKWQKPKADWEEEHANRVHGGRVASCKRHHEPGCKCAYGEPIRPKLKVVER